MKIRKRKIDRKKGDRILRLFDLKKIQRNNITSLLSLDEGRERKFEIKNIILNLTKII